MCTVALAHKLYPGAPIVLLANRDEQLARPASPPRDHGAYFGPRDEVSGGTWLGIARSGLVAAITNRFGHARDPARRSRGLVVLEALEGPSARAAAARLAAAPPSSVSPFHLLIADEEELHLVFHDGERLVHRALPPGWAVLTERSLAGPPPSRELAVSRALAAHERPPSPEEARAILSVHAKGDGADERLAATCVHLPELGYGTRSSTYLYLEASPRFLHADTSPCASAPRDESAALRRFFDAPGAKT